jgi:hypothetical protein
LQYEPKFWWFELVVITTKMLMTGALSVVAPGTPAQMLLTCIVLLAYLLVVLKLAPYRFDADDTMSFISTLSLFFTMLFGFALAMDEREYFNKHQVGIALIVMNCCVVVLQASNIVFIKCKAVDKAADLARSLSRKYTKVTPAARHERLKQVRLEHGPGSAEYKQAASNIQ